MNTLSDLLEKPSQGAQAPQIRPLRTVLEREILPRWLPECRWFRSKGRTIASTTFESLFPLASGNIFYGRVRVLFTDGGLELYQVPLTLATPKEAALTPESARLGPVPDPGDDRILLDACWNADFRAELYGLLFPAARSAHGLSRVLSAEQSNTSIVYGTGDDAVFVKLYRKLEAGIHPEPEMLRFLRQDTSYRHVPEFRAALESTSSDGVPSTVALAQEFLPGGVNAWEHVLDRLRAGRGEIPDDLLALAGRMGRRVGELHAALGSRPDLPAFAPEPVNDADLVAARTAVLALLDHALAFLRAGNTALPPETAALARTLLAGSAPLRASLLDPRPGGLRAADHGCKIRTHGDLHLGQMLVEGDDIRILDFEGEPGRPLEAARVKQSPLRDAAGMLRSFHYAAHVVWREEGQGFAETAALNLGKAFLDEYGNAAGPGGILPADPAERLRILDLFLLEKAVYELQYEWNNRPDWVAIPLRGLLSIQSGIQAAIQSPRQANTGSPNPSANRDE